MTSGGPFNLPAEDRAARWDRLIILMVNAISQHSKLALAAINRNDTDEARIQISIIGTMNAALMTTSKDIPALAEATCITRAHLKEMAAAFQAQDRAEMTRVLDLLDKFTNKGIKQGGSN